MSKVVTLAIVFLTVQFNLLAQDACSIQSVDLLTDRDYILAGTELNGQVFLTGTVNTKSSVTLLWVDPKNEEQILENQSVRLNNQQGNFSLKVNKELRSGWKWLSILHPETNQLLAAKKIYVINKDQQLTKSGESTPMIYPEGGHWITGHKQRFIIRTSPLQKEVLLLDRQQVVDTLSTANGFAAGSLQLTDSSRFSFRFETETGYKSATVIPQSQPALLIDSKGDNLVISVGGIINSALTLTILSDSDSISYGVKQNEPIMLPIRFLPKGLKHLKLSSGSNMLVERWYYLAKEQNVKLYIETPDVGQTNNNLSINASVTDPINQQLNTVLFSHSYYRYFQHTDNGLNADLNLLNEHWRRKLIANANSTTEINDLLIGATFLSGEMARRSKVCLPNGIKITGELTAAEASGQSLLLAIPGAQKGLYSATTFSRSFEFPDIIDNQQKTGYLSGKPTIQDGSIIWPNSFSIENLDWSSDEQPNPQVIEHQLQLEMIRENYPSEFVKKSIAVSSAEKKIYRLSDYTIALDEYVYLEDMPTVIKEIIPYVFFKRKRIMVFSEEQRKTFPGAPLLLVDGIPVTNDSTIINLDPGTIDYVDVLNSRNTLIPLGYVAKNGVVAIYTKERNFVPENTLRIVIPSYALAGKSYQYAQDKPEANWINLNDISVWKTYPSQQFNNFKLESYLSDLGGQFDLLIGAFHPRLGISFERKTIQIEYSNAK